MREKKNKSLQGEAVGAPKSGGSPARALIGRAALELGSGLRPNKPGLSRPANSRNQGRSFYDDEYPIDKQLNDAQGFHRPTSQDGFLRMLGFSAEGDHCQPMALGVSISMCKFGLPDSRQTPIRMAEFKSAYGPKYAFLLYPIYDASTVERLRITSELRHSRSIETVQRRWLTLR